MNQKPMNVVTRFWTQSSNSLKQTVNNNQEFRYLSKAKQQWKLLNYEFQTKFENVSKKKNGK